jgi:hypothetical protein
MNKPTAAKATTNTCRNDPESREINGTPKVEWFGFETNHEALVLTPTFSNQLPAFHRWTSPSRVHSNIPSSSWHNYSAADRIQALLTSLPQMVSPKSRETIGRILVDSIIIRKLQQRPNDLRAWPCISTDPKPTNYNKMLPITMSPRRSNAPKSAKIQTAHSHLMSGHNVNNLSKFHPGPPA